MVSLDSHVRTSSELERSQFEEQINGDAVLTTLQDKCCRAMLEATDCEGRTAKELADERDIPMSTVYRKLERLTELGLLQESMRIREDGNHVLEYSQAVEHIVVSIPQTGNIQVKIATEA